MSKVIVKIEKGCVKNVYVQGMEDCQVKVMDEQNPADWECIEHMVTKGVLYDALNRKQSIGEKAEEDTPCINPMVFLLIRDKEQVKTKTGRTLQMMEAAYCDGFLTAYGLYFKYIGNLFVMKNPMAGTVYQTMKPLNQILDSKYNAIYLRLNEEDYDNLGKEPDEHMPQSQETRMEQDYGNCIASLNGIKMKIKQSYLSREGVLYQGDLCIGDKSIAWFSDSDGGEPELHMKDGYSRTKFEDTIAFVEGKRISSAEFLIELQDLTEHEVEYRRQFAKGFPILMVQLVDGHILHYIPLSTKLCKYSDDDLKDMMGYMLDNNLRTDNGKEYSVKVYRSLDGFVKGTPIQISEILEDGGIINGDM